MPIWVDRVRAVRWGGWVLAATSLAWLAFRLWLGRLPGWYLALILLFVAGFLTVPLVLRLRAPVHKAGLILVAGVAGLIATVALGQGGLDAPLVVLLPFLPAAASFLVGGRAGWLMAAAICGLVAALALAHAHLALLMPWALDETLARSARALWLGTSSLLVALVIWLYDQRSGKLRRTLQIQASRDHLTGLLNRRHFEERLEEECRRAIREDRSLSLVMIDIDHFKAFNDTYGHPHGDRCLLAVSYAIGTSVRRAGDLLARFGGEEFIALFPGATEDQAVEIAETMRRAVAELEIPHEGAPEGVVTISLGVATGEGADRLDPATLVDTADAALYRAKEGGRNRIADSER